MRVLLGHSYFLRLDEKLWRAMQPYPPLGTLYAASMLRECGHDVRLFDAMLATSTDEWAALLDAERPDVAVLFEDNFNYLSKMCLLAMREAAFRMIAAARARGLPVVVAGADVTDNASLYIEHGADYAVAGEGEETVCELLDAIGGLPGPILTSDQGMPPASAGGEVTTTATPSAVSAIEGIVYRDETGVHSTERRQVMRNLDTLPAPARDLIDIERYREAWQHVGRFSMNLVTSRGCPFHCNWCAKPIWGQRYNVRSPASVVAEIETLRTLGTEHLWFMDDILGIKPGWLEEFADRVQAAGAVTPFKCLSRADLLLREGEIDALRRAGCEMVWVGAESGAQSVLDAMEKGTIVEQVREAARRLRDAGIGVAFFLQFGYPGETWDDIEATLQLVRDCAPDDIGMSVSYPLPGTPFHERVREQMTGRHNWVDSDEMAMLYDGPYPTSFYKRLHARLHTEFRLRKATHHVGVSRAVIDLTRRGRLKPALSLLRDAAVLPLQQAELELRRRRARRNEGSLRIELSRVEAGTPSAQDEGVEAPR